MAPRLVDATSSGPLISPVGVVVDGDGRVFISDSARKIVACFDAEGEHLFNIGKNLLGRPTGLALDQARERLLVVDTLLAMLEHDVLPCIPSKGSVGASGDLAPLAHLALPLIGCGKLDTSSGQESASSVLSAPAPSPGLSGR